MEEEMKRRKSIVEKEYSSRLIVFNIPKYMTEKQLADHFRQKGSITDCKIMRKEARSRKFAFIGYKNVKDAKAALEYFNNTYLDTCK
jgi:multiple RNA-binding domain-containing protein 1